jgi:hypothetical protein
VSGNKIGMTHAVSLYSCLRTCQARVTGDFMTKLAAILDQIDSGSVLLP